LLQPLFQYILQPIRALLDHSSYFFASTDRDVREIMERDDDFPIGSQVGPAMVCGAFVLGTDRGPLFREDLSFLWETFYRAAACPVIPPGKTIVITEPPSFGPLFAAVTARVQAIINRFEHGDVRVDLVQDILRPQCVRVVQEFLGIGPAEDKWLEVLWDILGILALRIMLPSSATKPSVIANLAWAQRMLEIAIDETLAAAMTAECAGGAPRANIVAQMCCVLANRNPPLPPEAIRAVVTRQVSGLAITGCLPIAKAAAQVVDILLSNPAAFRGATAAALAQDEPLFWDFIEEALRFFPPFPLVLRGCPRDTVIGADSARPRKVRAGQTVTVGLLPAMFDPAAVPFPYQFRTDRAQKDSLVFGRAVHACFGYHFARRMLCALLMPLFACGFTRAPGRRGKLSFDAVVPRRLELTLSPPGTGKSKC
ncbi:MAG: cytochrome P450, partial [Pseudolabrys sp.]|nr:cytochrome P450 [Pseudolabrys sp.]